jgi:DNA modification methylase
VDLPPKCLIGIPWRVALAMIDDGWILRNAVIWYKPNHMPSSVKDRLTQTYEYIFHFVKSRRYYYNLDNIREPHTSLKDLGRSRLDTKTPKHDLAVSVGAGNIGPSGYLGQHPLGRNPGDTWNSNGNLEKLIQICLKEYEKAMKERKPYNHKGGENAPESFKAASEWNRGSRETMNKIIDSLPLPEEVKAKLRSWWHDVQGNPKGKNPGDFFSIPTKPFKGAHFAVFPPELPLRPILASCPPDGIVLDPLAGSGTVAVTCELINRGMWDEFRIPVNETAKSVKWNLKWILIEINPEYCKLAEERLKPFIKQKRLDEFKRT